MQFLFTRQVPLAMGAVMLACVATFAQQRSIRELTGINGPVRTVRIESRQLRAVTDRQWGVMVYTVIYDAQGRPLENAEYLPGGNPDTKSTWSYDERGNEIEYATYVHDQLTGRSTTRYDARNRKLERLSFDANGKQTRKITFQYDQRGREVAFEVQPDARKRRLSVTVLDGRGNELERIEYRQNGASEGRYVYRYDAAGNKTSEVQYYEKDGRTKSSKSTYVYDENSNLIEEALYFDGTLDNKKTYQRDRRGNQINLIETDDKGQVNEKRSWSYEFDGEGNWTRAVISEWTNKAPTSPFQATYEIRRIFGKANDATIALWSAAAQGAVERVQELLRLGADVNASHPDSGTSLIKAATQGHRDVVQVLLAAGAQVDRRDADGWTALMWSAEYGRVETVKLLLAGGADPNASNEVGGVPIMPASLNGHVEVLRLLLAKGANVNAAAGDGSTALMVSAREGQAEAINFLLSQGADPGARTRDGLTALFFAARSIAAVRALLVKDVDVNVRSNNGSTPLMVAAGQPETAVLKLLIEKGADVNAKTNDGETALSIALKAELTEAADLLKQAGAK